MDTPENVDVELPEEMWYAIASQSPRAAGALSRASRAHRALGSDNALWHTQFVRDFFWEPYSPDSPYRERYRRLKEFDRGLRQAGADPQGAAWKARTPDEVLFARALGADLNKPRLFVQQVRYGDEAPTSIGTHLITDALRARDYPRLEALLAAGANPNVALSGADRYVGGVVRARAGPGVLAPLIHLLGLPGHATPARVDEKLTAYLQLLLKYGAKPDHPSYAAIERVLEIAERSGGTAYMSAVESLLRHGASANAFDRRPPLHIAAGMGDEALVALLLRWGADPALVDAAGRTLEDAAAVEIRAELPRLIRMYGMR